MSLGIISGLGPNSSYRILDLFAKLILQKTGKLPYFNCLNVDGVDFLNCVYSQTEPPKRILASLDKLYDESDCVAALCNTFYATDFYSPYVNKKQTFHLPKMCLSYLSPLLSNQKIGVVGTRATIESGLYSGYSFDNKSISISELTIELQYELDAFLQRTESMFPKTETIYEFSNLRAKILNFFKSVKCNVILLACTDLDEFFQNICDFQLYSTRTIFAELLATKYFQMENETYKNK